MRFLDVFRRGIEKLLIQPERIARGRAVCDDP
jgi:hypothetical protein